MDDAAWIGTAIIQAIVNLTKVEEFPIFSKTPSFYNVRYI